MYVDNRARAAMSAASTAAHDRPSASRRTMGRRQLLALAGITATTPTLTSCDLLATDPDGEGENEEPPDALEAPELSELVERGELPPLDERLPVDPMVLEGPDGPGQYGGDLNMLLFPDQTDDPRMNSSIGYEGLVRWKPGTTALTPEQVMPNVAESFASNEDSSEFTFTLREGLRWSDGEPFTADDIVFWYGDVAKNEELNPVFPQWLNPGGGDEPLVVEKVDDHTVVFRFSAPYALFVEDLATPRGYDLTAYPAHYLKQFHADYADDLDAEMEDAGAEDWMDLFMLKAGMSSNPEKPVLHAWMLTAGVADATQQLVAERNPYYWKTDAEGRQLPYTSRVVFHLVREPEPAILKVTNGEIDVVDRDINELSNKPVFAESRESAGYQFFDTIPIAMNQMMISLNMAHQDPELREIFANKDFRIGLSHAINRQDIIDAVFQRQGEPWQGAPRPESPYHNESLAKQYTEFDQDLANEYLDRVVPEKDGDGFRLRPDGERLFILVEINNAFMQHIDAMKMVEEQWAEVGIEISTKVGSQNLYRERTAANEHDASTGGGGGGLTARTDPVFYMPFNFNARWATPWYVWYENPDDPLAEEPPEEVRRQIDAYREFRTTTDRDEQDRLMHEVMSIAEDEFYSIGIAMRRRQYGIFGNRLRNTPQECITGWGHVFLMPTNPQLYYHAAD